jgi:hypothetical protein
MAVTRGKRLVVVVGQTKALALAVKRLGSVTYNGSVSAGTASPLG